MLALREKVPVKSISLQVAVKDNGSFVGMITRERLVQDIRLRADLGA